MVAFISGNWVPNCNYLVFKLDLKGNNTTSLWNVSVGNLPRVGCLVQIELDKILGAATLVYNYRFTTVWNVWVGRMINIARFLHSAKYRNFNMFSSKLKFSREMIHRYKCDLLQLFFPHLLYEIVPNICMVQGIFTFGFDDSRRCCSLPWDMNCLSGMIQSNDESEPLAHQGEIEI